MSYIEKVEMALYRASYDWEWNEFKNCRRNGHVSKMLRVVTPWKNKGFGFVTYLGSSDKDCVMRLLKDTDNKLLNGFFEEYNNK